MSVALVIFLAALQGATELFPVSSLGHAVVVPALFHLGVDPAAPSFVPFLTLLHFGTGLALVMLYRDQWWRIVRGFVAAAVRGPHRDRRRTPRHAPGGGHHPRGVIGFLLETPLKSCSPIPRTAAGFLVVNGAVLAGAEVLRRRDERRARRTAARGRARSGFGTVEEPELRPRRPGRASSRCSRCSRASPAPASPWRAAWWPGLRHTEAVRFAFLLATPIILAAGLLEVPQLPGSGAPLGLYAVGAVVAGRDRLRQRPVPGALLRDRTPRPLRRVLCSARRHRADHPPLTTRGDPHDNRNPAARRPARPARRALPRRRHLLRDHRHRPPGQQVGRHYKHAVVAAVLAVLCFIGANFARTARRQICTRLRVR